MKKLNYRLIVSDFDGTLIDGGHLVPQKVKNAIEEYTENGGIFAVCTGRMPNSILPQVRKLGLKGLVAAYQGTIICEIESGKVIRDGGIEHGEIAEICRRIEAVGTSVIAYSGEKLYTDIPEDNEYLQLYESIIGVKARSVEGKLSDFILKNRIFCQKVASLVSRSDRDRLYPILLKQIGKKYDVTCSAANLVEVSPQKDNKGEALKFLASYFNVPIELTVGVGDNLNDLSLIRAAGVGVAVGNAEPELKRAADYVSTTNDEGAIAEIIYKYGFA